MVFLPGLVDGTLPIVYARTPAALAEERRLFYGGAPRPRPRRPVAGGGPRPGGGPPTRTPSAFLQGLRSPGRPVRA